MNGSRQHHKISIEKVNLGVLLPVDFLIVKLLIKFTYGLFVSETAEGVNDVNIV